MVVPLFWCTVTGLTLWTMESPEAFVTPLAASVALCLAAWKSAATRAKSVEAP